MAFKLVSVRGLLQIAEIHSLCVALIGIKATKIVEKSGRLVQNTRINVE